jgi:general secretion pathway protein D
VTVISPRLRRLVAATQVLSLLWLAGCSSLPWKKKAPPETGPPKVTVSAESGVVIPGPGQPPVTPPAAGASPPRGAVPPVPAPEGKPPLVLSVGPAPGEAPKGRGKDDDNLARDKDRKRPEPPGPSGAGADPLPPLRLRQAATETAGTPPPQSPGRLVVFNFDNADIEIVLQATSELLIFNYVLAPGAKGKKVTVQTTGRIPVDDVFPVLLTILDVNGLAAVRSGNLYRIIPKEGAVQTSTRTIVGRRLDPAIPGDQVVTLIVPLQFASAADVVALIRPFVPPQGNVSAHRDTNLLVLTDATANLRRMLDIVALVDVDVALNELQIIPLKHADAQEVGQILTQLFASGRFRPGGAELPAAVTPPPAAVRPAPTPAVPGAPPRPAVPGAEVAPGQERAPLIVPERRSNSLIVYARKQEMETIRRLVEKLDADIYGGQRVYIYFAENTKARDLAATLDAIFGRGGTPPPAPGARAQPGVPLGGLGPSPTTQQQRPTVPFRPPTLAGAPGAPGEEGPLAAELRFIPDDTTNAIVVTTYPRVWVEIEQVIKKLDRMPRQVLIDVLVAEITLDDSTKLGIEWAVRTGRFDLNFSGNVPAGSGLGVIGGRPPRDIIPGGGLIPPGLNFFTFGTDEFLVAVNALANENKVNVLSNPSIMTAENKKAVINVSRSVPILTSQQVPLGAGTTTTGSAIVGTQTVEYRDAGIILTVTPRIGEQGTVALDVKQEVNDVGAPVPPTNSPEFKKREAETSVVLLTNQTLVLGGLIQNERRLIQTGIPYLNKIPLIGLLFGSTEEVTKKTELILLITPRVVGTPLDAWKITEEIRRATPEIRDSTRDFPRPPISTPPVVPAVPPPPAVPAVPPPPPATAPPGTTPTPRQ